MFESCWAHHSTRVPLASGEPKARSWRAIRQESKGHLLIHFHSCDDDGIVVCVWFVYILRCSNGSLYVGETDDIGQRLADHNRGRGSSHTKRYRPWNFIVFRVLSSDQNLMLRLGLIE